MWDGRGVLGGHSKKKKKKLYAKDIKRNGKANIHMYVRIHINLKLNVVVIIYLRLKDIRHILIYGFTHHPCIIQCVCDAHHHHFISLRC